MTLFEATRRRANDRSSFKTNAEAEQSQTLIQAGGLVRSTHGSTYAFDDPFVRGWVIARALPDLGIRDKAIRHSSTPTSEYDAYAPDAQVDGPPAPG